MNLGGPDRELLSRYTDEAEDLNSKRKVSSAYSDYEQEAKRIRKDAEERVVMHPENTTDIQKEMERNLEAAYKAFWDYVGGEMLAWFSTQDFHIVYRYMKEIWPLNNLLREHEASWRQRLVLEYPEFWLLNGDNNIGKLSQSAVHALLSETAQGSGPRSRPATEADAMYLLYQKARRLTRYIFKKATEGKKMFWPVWAPRQSKKMPLQHSDLELPFSLDTYEIVNSGPYIVVYAITKERDDGEDKLELYWIDMSRKSAFVSGHMVVENEPSLAIHVDVGEGWLFVSWSISLKKFYINALRLENGEWFFPRPVNIGPKLEQNGLSFERNEQGTMMSRVNVLALTTYPIPDSDEPQLHMSLEKLLEWVTAGMVEPIEKYSFELETLVFPGQVRVSKRWFRGVFVEGKWIFPNYRLPIPPAGPLHVYRLNFHNSYERPVLARARWTNGLEYLSDYNIARKLESNLPPTRYFIESDPESHLANDTLLLEDHSDEMRAPSALVAVTLATPTWMREVTGLAVPNRLRMRTPPRSHIFVYANYIYRVLPTAGMALSYDLWDKYKQSRTQPKERNRPLFSQPHLSTCSVCSAPASGVCSDCQVTNYCSAQCMNKDRANHIRICKQ